ncbi:hypothetical protein BLNAU_6814 [Blattamonas nauphoetae]|uniref:E3 ubiquitin-protein ligase n=1 Tax=Blattamonas nauphoetae TaxID=2049346 RepID=A0ABQ9Y2Z0_9EUKA|nr:hypothetical protein BLNAU_6814 [Blattamonas nauphoetae]
MCSRHRKNQNVTDPLISIKNKATKKLLQEFFDAIVDIITDLLCCQIYQTYKLWDTLRLLQTIDHVIQNHMDSKSLVLQPFTLLSQSDEQQSSSLLDSPETTPPPQPSTTTPPIFEPALPAILSELTALRVNTFNPIELIRIEESCQDSFSKTYRAPPPSDSNSQAETFPTRRALMGNLFSVLQYILSNGGGGVWRLFAFSLNRQRNTYNSPTEPHFPHLHSSFMRIVAETEHPEEMRDVPRPTDLNPVHQFDPNDPLQQQSTNSHLRFWMRFNRLFSQEEFALLFLSMTKDNAFIHSFIRAYWENYPAIKLPPRFHSRAIETGLAGIVTAQNTNEFESVSAQLDTRLLLRMDPDINWIVTSILTTFSASLQTIIKPSLTFLFSFLNRTGLNQNPSYSTPRHVLVQHSQSLNGRIQRMNWIIQKMNENEQTITNSPTPSTSDLSDLSSLTPHLPPLRHSGDMQVVDVFDKQPSTTLFAVQEDLMTEIGFHVIVKHIHEHFTRPYNSLPESFSVTASPPPTIRQRQDSPQVKKASPFKSWPGQSLPALAHSSTMNTLREEYRSSFDQNGQTLDSSPIADLLLLLTPFTSCGPMIRVLSQQPFLQFAAEEELTVVTTGSMLLQQTLPLTFTSTSATRPFLRTLISIIAQRMLSRSPLVALYPYRPQAPYSHSHHVLNVADSVAFAPPSPTPLDVDITWDDVPVVLQRILIKEKTGEQLEQEGRGENIVETIESIIFANDSTAFNQALLDAIRIDDENTTLQVSIPIAGQSPSLSGFRPIASFAPVPLLEQQTVTLTTPKAKKALSKPSSSPVFAASSPRPPPKEFVPVKDKSGEVFVPLVLSPMSGGYLPLESSSPIVSDRSSSTSPNTNMLTTSAPPSSEVSKLKQFVTRLLLHRMHFEVPFTTNLLNHRLAAFTLANHISLAANNDPLSTLISPEESLLLCEEPLNIRVVFGQVLNDMWRRNNRHAHRALNRYLYPSMLYSNVFPDAFIIQVAICAAGWDRFLTLFLTNTHLDFFFLPPFFWSKMGKIQKDCTHALENQTVSFIPDDVERVGCGWEMEPDAQLSYAGHIMITLLSITNSRMFHFQKSDIVQKIENKEKLASDTILIDNIQGETLLNHTDDAIVQSILSTLALGDAPYSTLTQNIPLSLYQHRNFDGILKKLATTSTGRQQILQLNEQAWDQVDVFYPQFGPQKSEQAIIGASSNLKQRKYHIYDPHTDNTTDYAEYVRAEVPYKTGSEPEDVSISPSLPGLPHPITPLPQFTHLLDIATSRIFLGITWDILHVTSHLQNQLGGVTPPSTDSSSAVARSASESGLMGARAASGLSITLTDSSSPPPSEGATPFDHHVPEFDYTKSSVDKVLLPILRLLDLTLCFSSQWQIEPGKELKQPRLSESDVHPLSLPCPPNTSLIEALFTPIQCHCLPLTTNHSHTTNTSIASLLYDLYTYNVAHPATAIVFVPPLLCRLLIRLRFVAKVFFPNDPRLQTWLRSIGLTESANQKTESERDAEDKKQKAHEARKRIIEQMKQTQTNFANANFEHEETEHEVNEHATGLTCMFCHAEILRGESAGYLSHIECRPMLQTLNTSAIYRHRLRELVKAIKAKGQRKQLERRLHKWWHKTKSLEDEEFERQQKELLEQEKSEMKKKKKKKGPNSDDLVSSEEGLSGADDDGDKVLAGLQDTDFGTIAQLLQPSEDDGLNEYFGAMESIADTLFASNSEVEGEEEMTDEADDAFSFGSEDELSDSDTSDMDVLLATLITQHATVEPEAPFLPPTEDDRRYMEHLLAMLGPVDSSDSVMRLISTPAEAQYFLGIDDFVQRKENRKMIEVDELARDDTTECDGLLKEVGWEHKPGDVELTRVPLHPHPEGNLRVGLPLRRLALSSLKNAKTVGSVDWLDEFVLTQGTDADLWGDYESGSEILTDSQFLPTATISATTHPFTHVELEQNCRGGEKEPLKETVSVQTCGHAIHTSCFAKMIGNKSTSETRLNEPRIELNCPACRRPSNCLVPVLSAMVSSVSPDGPEYTSMERAEKQLFEEERVKALIENGYILKTNTPLLVHNPHISRPDLRDAQTEQAGRLLSLFADIEVCSTTFLSGRELFPLIPELLMKKKDSFRYSHKPLSNFSQNELIAAPPRTLFPKRNERHTTHPKVIKLNRIELHLCSFAVLTAIVYQTPLNPLQRSDEARLQNLQQSPGARFALNRIMGLDDYAGIRNAADEEFVEIPPSKGVKDLNTHLSSLREIEESLKSKPALSSRRRLEILESVLHPISDSKCLDAPLDPHQNPILIPLTDTISLIEWSLRPFVLPGVAEFADVIEREKDSLETMVQTPGQEENAVSFFFKHRTPPISTRHFHLTHQQCLMIVSLFRTSSILISATTSFTPKENRGRRMAAVISELIRMRISAYSASILSLLSQCPDSDIGGFRWGSVEDMLVRERTQLSKNAHSWFDGGLRTLRIFNGSDPLSLLVQLLALGSFVQTDKGITSVPVTPTLFVQILWEILGSLAHTSESSSPLLFSDDLNPKNGDFVVHSFLRRAFILFSALFEKDTHLQQFHAELAQPLFTPSSSHETVLKLAKTQAQQAYLIDLNSMPVYRVPTITSLLAFFRHVTPQPSSLTFTLPESPSLLPSALLLPSFVALPLLHHDALLCASSSVCPHCKLSPTTLSAAYSAVCLSCGRSICMSGSCCVRKSNLRSFVREEGGKISTVPGNFSILNHPLAEELEHSLLCPGPIFPLVGTCPIVISPKMLTFESQRLASLYLDEHGEEDIGSIRGLPLILSLNHYSQLLGTLCEHHFSDREEWSS